MGKDLKIDSKTFENRCVKMAISLPKTKLGSILKGN